jgi:hypothetical protein
MGKIPQGEWNAIAARYSKGESLSSIARSYGCTPPAIHYILKRVKEPSTETATASTLVRTEAADKATSQHQSDNGHIGRSVARIVVNEDTVHKVDPFPLPQQRIEKGERYPAPTLKGARNGQQLPTAAQRPLGASRPLALSAKPLGAGQPPALTAELDAQLQAHAEDAIEAFRLSFAAALAEASPASRHRLRHAAADLMRAAARTTIVLDRVEAGSKRRDFDATA